MPKVTNCAIVATSIAGPWGPIHVAASERGIVAIDVLAPRAVFEADLERRFGCRPMFGPPTSVGPLRDGVRAIRAHLDGRPNAFDGLTIDIEDRPAWDRAVLDAVRAIPHGSTASYGDVATAIGRRGAARAVGGAVGRNPVALAIPCHRVIAGDGTLGGYGGGWWGSHELRLGLKRDLLAREGTTVRDRAAATRPGR